MPYASARNGIAHRFLSYSVYERVVAFSWFRSTLSRLMYGVRSTHAPDEQNLPTMSVEYERPTSGPLPAPIAWVTLESSCPGLMVTLMFGWVASKSFTTVSIAWASRSVKKCHSSTVPETCVPGSATLFSFGAGVHAVT